MEKRKKTIDRKAVCLQRGGEAGQKVRREGRKEESKRIKQQENKTTEKPSEEDGGRTE